MRKSALYGFGLVVAILVALGLVVLSSASEANGIRIHKDAYFFIKRQFIYLALGLVVAAVTAAFDYHLWRDREVLSWLFFIFVVGLLLAVFLFPPINGSRRWLPLKVFSLQPSELAKLAVVVMLSVRLDKAGWRVELFKKGALESVIFIALLAGLIISEPDFGATMVVGLVGFLIMFVAGVRVLHMLPFALAGLGVGLALVLTNANRLARLFDEDKQYQVKMALAAIGNGEVFGVGLGQSMQKHLYLPEAHTDFIFAIGAEELGMVYFSIPVLVLFFLFLALAVVIARNASDRFGRFLVVGMTFIIFFQAMFNIGVVAKAFPTKGMALPFFSYGGTNMISAFFAVGTILSVGIHSYRDRKRQVRRG